MANPFATGQPFVFTFKPAAAPAEEKKDDDDDDHGGHDDAHHLEEESKAEFTPVVRLTVRSLVTCPTLAVSAHASTPRPQ